ncbi:calcium homeostasis modulator protein 6-like [Tachysurus fulvidraco]|uniref:calcium homeostasis modulator protein 6-like n=1 Tax=Tachysurus fulvidraco TaxID=1234273 RepID=UPI001FEF9C8B|nr:calcium homeostasis modulator protein 6-like [Tachysurus fulvidraco]
MISAKGLVEFLRKLPGRFGIFSLILVALEQIMDYNFVCPCQRAYNISMCVLYGAVPALGCFLLTFSFIDLSLNTEGRQSREITKRYKGLYSSLTASVWLFLFFFDGGYVACAVSDWEGVYAHSDKLGIERWCKPTGNKTSELESQQITLKWISRSQILGFIILVCVLITLLCVHHCTVTHTGTHTVTHTVTHTEEPSRMKLHSRRGDRKSVCEVEEITCL